MKKYHLIVFGCQMNISDAERVATVLEKIGYKKTLKLEEANLVIVTMCSIRQSAVDRVHWLAEKFNPTSPKKIGLRGAKKPITILTGCILEKDKKVFVQGFDYVVDIKEIKKIPELLQKINRKTLLHSRECQSITNNTESYLNIEPKHSSPFSASVPIMTGCNNFCAYCVVPYTREREISRPAKDIITEVKKLVKNDYKEIWLLGQNVNSYKDPQSKTTFAELLIEINKLKGDFWVRYTSSHPKDFKQDVIDAMAQGNHITPYLNLPIQSGDDKVLHSMKRWYTVKHYKKIITDLRKKIPNIAISTDIIVGFPGETKKQFENTVKLFKDIKYDMAYINKYSPRAGTSAAKLIDDVSWPEKKRREKVLTDTLRKVAYENNKKLIGKTIKVLIDRKKDGVLYGKSDTYKSVRIVARHSRDPLRPRSEARSGNPEIGKFINAKIIKADNWNLEGNIYETTKQ